MKSYNVINAATAALFCAFFVSCLYETWRDFAVQRLTEPTPILRISDNPRSSLSENTPYYVLCFVVAFVVSHGRVWTTMAGIAYTILMMFLNAVYLFDVFPKRIETSPLAVIDCCENVIYTSFLGIALCLLFLARHGITITLDQPSDNKQIDPVFALKQKKTN